MFLLGKFHNYINSIKIFNFLKSLIFNYLIFIAFLCGCKEEKIKEITSHYYYNLNFFHTTDPIYGISRNFQTPYPIKASSNVIHKTIESFDETGRKTKIVHISPTFREIIDYQYKSNASLPVVSVHTIIYKLSKIKKVYKYIFEYNYIGDLLEAEISVDTNDNFSNNFSFNEPNIFLLYNGSLTLISDSRIGYDKKVISSTLFFSREEGRKEYIYSYYGGASPSVYIPLPQCYLNKQHKVVHKNNSNLPFIELNGIGDGEQIDSTLYFYDDFDDNENWTKRVTLRKILDISNENYITKRFIKYY
jgi:hypothetical protein